MNIVETDASKLSGWKTNKFLGKEDKNEGFTNNQSCGFSNDDCH